MSGTVVSTEALLNSAIAALDGTAVAGTYTITLSNNITLASTLDLDALNLHTGVNVVIDGNGFTLDGGGVQRGIFVNAGNVTIENLTIAHAVAQGGAGGLGVRDAGGGGAGLGGGLFIGSSATVTLSSVSFSSDQAKGGAGGNSFGAYNTVTKTALQDGGYGGGGGMGGAGGFGIGFDSGGGGGLGKNAAGGTILNFGGYGQTTPGTGIDIGGSSAGSGVVYPGGGTNTAQKGGKYGGGGGYGSGFKSSPPYAGAGAGGGGVGGSNGSLTGGGTGGNGGFGGGAGGGYEHGGNGGFGGGGGGGYASSGIGGFGGGGGGGGAAAAAGGFGGGSGGTAGTQHGGAGGGGLGAGGDLFVDNGGSLIIQAGTLSGGSVAAGSGGVGTHLAASGAAGSAFGSGIFLQGSQSISLAPTAGQTLTVSDVIADQTGSGGTGTNAAAGFLVIGGGGLVALGAANTFTGGSTIQSGATLDLTASGAGGTGAISFASGSSDQLQIQNAALSSNQLTNTVSLLAAGDAIDLAGLSFAAGKSTATFTSGVLSVNNGTTTDKITLAGVSAGTSFVAVQDHSTGIAALMPNFTVGNLSQITADLTSINNGGAAGFGNVPFAFTLTAAIALGSVQTLNLLGGSSLTLSGTAATGGGWNINAGTLVAGGAGLIGNGSVVVASGASLSLNNFAQTITDLTGAGAVALGSGTLTEGSSNNTSFSGVVSGTGGLVKQGSGTTTLGAANSFSGGIALNSGALVLGHTGAAGTGTISFAAGTPQTLGFAIANAPTNTIAGFEIGDTFDLTNATDVTATNLLANHMLEIVRSGGGTIDVQLDAGVAGKFFHHASDGVTGTAITESSVACYLLGTRIMTDRGEVPVEDLAIGDRVITLDSKAKPIKWIGRRSYASAFAAGNRDVVPIWIEAGALADGVPKRDLIVSPLHALYLDGRLVPAGALMNGISIRQRPDIDPIRYFHIELAQHDVIYAEGAPAETFVDCDSRGMFNNAAEFDALYPGDDSPVWAFCAPRVDAGPALVPIRRAINRRAGIEVRDDIAPGPLQGFLDGIDGARLTGWAFDADNPDQPVVLQVLDDLGVIAQVTADRYRQDLADTGIGNGQHGFELILGAGLAALPRRLHVRRAADATELTGSPLLLLRPAAGPDMLRRAITATAQRADANSLGELLDVLLQGVEQVRHQHAALPRDDEAAPLLTWRGGRRSAPRRALVIDDLLPQPGHNAGSNAILSHISALQALGWDVDFVAAHQGPADDKAAAALQESGVRCHRAPMVASVEEVLRRQRDAFDVVYLHRLSNAEAYAGLARAWQKRAHVLFSVADLHHLRLARQARAQSCIEVMSEARAMREREFAAMRMVDAVITHSTAEAAYLAKEATGARVHVVPWAIAPQARVVSWAARDGIAFIGGYRHGPNPDAARFLAETVMPLVWQALPNVPLMIVGDEWPAALPWARDERIRMAGRIRRLADVFDLVRLTVAPLRFGAGLKGKVLDSFAAGIPCVMSPVAAEGMPLCPTLQTLVGEDAAGMAAQIVRLHSDAGAAIACRDAGLSMVETAFSAEAVAQALAPALGPMRARSARRKAAAGPSPKSRDARTDAGKRRSAPGH